MENRIKSRGGGGVRRDLGRRRRKGEMGRDGEKEDEEQERERERAKREREI